MMSLCFSQSHGVISWSALFSSSHSMQAWNRILTQLPCENYPSSALDPETAADTQWSVYRHKLLTDCQVSHCSEKKCRPVTAKEAFCGLIIDLLAVTMSPCRGNSSLLLLSEPSLSQSTVWTELNQMTEAMNDNGSLTPRLHCHQDRCSSTSSCNNTCIHFRFNLHLHI